MVSDVLKKVAFNVWTSNDIGSHLKLPELVIFSIFLHVEANGGDVVEKEQDVLGFNFEFVEEVFNVATAVGILWQIGFAITEREPEKRSIESSIFENCVSDKSLEWLQLKILNLKILLIFGLADSYPETIWQHIRWYDVP